MNATRLSQTAPSLRYRPASDSPPPWREPDHVVVETCVENVEGVRASARAGADRAELCDNLAAGGTTPSIGAVEAAIFAAAEEVERRRAIAGVHWASGPAAAPLGLRIMIRPRGGSFVFDADEVRAMTADVRRIAALSLQMSEFTRPQRVGGARSDLPPAVDLGFVVGALTEEHTIDRGLLRLLVLLLAAGVTAQVVSRLGVISFAGLAGASVAHLLRVRAMGARFALSFLAGGLLLLVVDSLLNIAGHFLGTLLPAGALCGVLGAPFLIFLVLRQRKSAQGFAREAPPSAPSPRLASWRTPLLGLAVLLALLVLSQGFTAGADGWGWHWQGELILDHRLPRSLSAVAVGVMLACAGVLLQTLTRNPMVSPEVLGISSGVALAVIAAFLAFPALGSGGLLLAGAGGALMVAVLVLWLARRLQPAWLLVTGVAVAALMQGVMTVVQLSGNPQLQGVLSWLAGSTWYARPHTAPLLVLLALVLLAAALLCGKALQLLAFGETVAGSLGLAVRRSRSLLLVLVALMSAVATLAVGPLSFIGLMTPHLARRSGAVSPEKQLPIAALYGAALMLIADWLGRYLIFPYELGAGVIASLLGGGFFLLLLRQARPIN